MAAWAFIGVTSCNTVVLSEPELESGFMSVSLDRDDEVLSKALISPDADMAFEIKVYKGNELVATVADHRTLNQENPLQLPIGKYRVTASYGDNGIGFDCPYYVGETEVVIKTDQLTEADLVCTLANVMVTVEFDQSIIDNFPTYSVMVDDGSLAGTVLNFSSTLGNVARVGYIPATGTLKWNLNLLNIDGVSYISSGTYTDVKPRQHYNLKFVLSENTGEGGYVALKLIVDNTLVQEECDITLDFSESELPTFESNEGFDLTNEMSVIIGDDSKKELNFSAPEGIKSFILAVDNSVLTRSSQSLKRFELVQASSETISYLAGIGIKTESIPYGAVTARIDITDYIKNLPTGDYNVDATLYDTKGHVASCPMDFAVISPVEADIVSVTPWARFVIVKGKYFSATAPAGLTFMYKKSSDASWTTLPASSVTVNSSTKTYEAEIGGLTGSTSYLIKAVTDNDTETREVDFTTETAPSLYNMSFDDWYIDGKVHNPFAQGANPNVWDTANEATTTFGDSGTTQETSHVVSGSAAKLKSQYIVIAFAAGNLYTGNFGAIDGLGAELYWGTPFAGRPMALKGYYDYAPAKIDNVESPYTSMKGKMDKCQIQIFITDWTGQFTINTTSGKFVDIENDPCIIAHAKFESDVNTGGYKEFTLPLVYRDNKRKPAFIVISACASYLGDYFTGGEGSTLYVDEFSFEYDVTKLDASQKAQINYR